MEIFPKIDECLTGINVLDEYIKKSKGVEVQMMKMDELTYEMNIESPLKYLTENYTLEEITIHLPISFCYIEYYFLKDEDIFYKLIDKVIELSKKYNINLNILFHTHWEYHIHEVLTFDKFNKLIDYLKDTKVMVLLENTIFSAKECSPILLSEHFNSEKLKVCLDLCHVKCRSVIYKTSINDYFNYYIPGNANKFIKQIHFSNNKNNDGYIDKSTHSAAHDLDENFVNDINILIKFGLIDKNFVTEINEIDYSVRTEEIKEIKLLEKVQMSLGKRK